MIHETVDFGIDAGNVLSLTLGLMIGYVAGRMHNRIEQAVDDVQHAQEDVARLRHEIEDEDHRA